jgi:hypothetical protein
MSMPGQVKYPMQGVNVLPALEMLLLQKSILYDELVIFHFRRRQERRKNTSLPTDLDHTPFW